MNRRTMAPFLVLISMPPSSILDVRPAAIGVGSDHVLPSSLLVRAPVGLDDQEGCRRPTL